MTHKVVCIKYTYMQLAVLFKLCFQYNYINHDNHHWLTDYFEPSTNMGFWKTPMTDCLVSTAGALFMDSTF